MGKRGAFAVGAFVLAVACSSTTPEEGGAGSLAGEGGDSGDSGATSNGGSGGPSQLSGGAAGSAASDAGRLGVGGSVEPPSACAMGDWNFGRGVGGESGSSQGSAELLSKFVGTWKLAPGLALDGDVYAWSIHADGTATFTETVGPGHPLNSQRTTVSRGTVRFGDVLFVLAVSERTVTTPSGTESHEPPENILSAYQYDEQMPNTLLIGPPDCGSLTLDPFLRQ